MNAPAEKPAQLPPMLAQYLEYKARYDECLIFFQVGDFYELFFEDAVTVARAINLTLTSRDKNSAQPVPMCGVPIAVIDGYLERLVALGHSCAIVSQGELPPGGKGMVPRRLERIVTPGVRVLGGIESDASGSLVAAVSIQSSGDVAIASTDVQSGRVLIREGISLDSLPGELGRLAPTELLLPKTLFGKPLDRRSSLVRAVEVHAKHAVLKFRAESPVDQGRALGDVPGYRSLSPTAKRAAHTVVQFLDEVTVSAKALLTRCEVVGHDESVAIDATTRANLELVRNARDGSGRGTLYEYLNLTLTPGGGRLLREWILSPLADRARIDARLERVSQLRKALPKLDGVFALLSRSPDIERVVTRAELGIVSPRELGSLRDILSVVPALHREIRSAVRRTDLISDLGSDLAALQERLSVLVDAPPPSLQDGGIIRAGVDPELDRAMTVGSDGKAWIAQLEAQERARTGIGSLKIRYNGVFGYFIEITNANLTKVPEDYTRKQTTANGERFVTPALKEREREVLSAEGKGIEIEKRIFRGLREEVARYGVGLRALSTELASLDVLLTFARLADRDDLVRPEIVETPEIEIVQGRHPQLSRLLQGSFIPNSLSLSPDVGSFVIITGPNMGGKSTFLRQAALLTILAQIGSFVPAKSARIGIVDRIFARLGASDDLSEGESTFMVEMREASQIIHHATSRSLLVIDEIGRGTATLDGLSIARAILEYVVGTIQCRTLFATHFHELTDLAETNPRIRNLSVTSIEREGGVLFTHEIRHGAASQSYGIEVAKLAGLPRPIISRARSILELLRREAERQSGSRQLTIFDVPTHPDPPSEPEGYRELCALREELAELDVNLMTPLQALTSLSGIVSRAQEVGEKLKGN